MKQAHIPLLKIFDDLKFNIGKKTLIDFAKGDPNSTIERNNLEDLDSYGSLFMLQKDDIRHIVEELLKYEYLEYNIVGGGFQIIKRTSKGLKEIFEKNFKLDEIEIKKINSEMFFEETPITQEDTKLFEVFDFFLGKYNNEQKKAIITDNPSILCVAGAGSGKTTVLTKRIEFLKKFKSVDEKQFLAITFTRKAKEEMTKKLENLGIFNIQVETFNSFCEKTLKKHSHKIYKSKTKVAQYKDKISIVHSAIKKNETPFETFFDDYFNKKQIREKTRDELFFIFVNDIFTVIDYYKNSEEKIKPFYQNTTNMHQKKIAKIIHDIAVESEKELKSRNLRDFSDQVNDTLELFKKHKSTIPKFKHILVDEFQDVNKVQVDLLKLLYHKNIFAVGDPRQAIYGWRGSEIKYILDFPKIFENTQVIQLKKNYRSDKEIVEFFNLSIKNLGLANLESGKIEDKTTQQNQNKIFLFEQDSENSSKRFVLEAIKNSKNPRNEIFVLARTNKILDNYADFFMKNGIKCAIKSEEEYKKGDPQKDEIVLATIHSIKGMEANEVYLVSANTLSFPNKVQDNFVFALMKNDNDYDKEAEELRLFYVALSRAKEKLIITYTGNHSKFITQEMLQIINFKTKNKSLFDFTHKPKIFDNSNASILKNMLKDWRLEKSQYTGLPVYMIISNSAIDDLVRLKPQNKIQMQNISGMGDIKIAKYGDELLKIING
jgi:superfamily I DNA/RNA helicase